MAFRYSYYYIYWEKYSPFFINHASRAKQGDNGVISKAFHTTVDGTMKLNNKNKKKCPCFIHIDFINLKQKK